MKMMASAKLVRDCSSELSSDVRSLSVASSTEEQDSTTTESEYSEEEKEYELDDLQMLKTIGELQKSFFNWNVAGATSL